MNSKIKDLLKKAGASDIPAALQDLAEPAFQQILTELKAPCRRYLYHQRMIEKLESKASRTKVGALKARLRWHRFWRRRAEARCEALEVCTLKHGKGC